MLVLALDTAAHLCSAALYDAERSRVVGHSSEDIGRGHAERMMAVLDAALDKAGAAYPDIGKIAVSVGPGSFTGIRVGVATARGLALALGVPVVGVTTLEALAGSVDASPAMPVLATIDASRAELYCQLFSAEGNGPARALGAHEAADIVTAHSAAIVGSGAAAIEAVLAEAGAAAPQVLSRARAPDIAVVARLGAKRAPADKPRPFYLRAPDAKEQRDFALPRRDALTP